jgi:alpha-ribazole phosphatase
LHGAVPKDLAIHSITSSDLHRALAGAETLATARDVALFVDRRWRELDFGAWDGLAPQSVPSDALTLFWDDPDAYPPPGGESWSTLQSRVAEALTDLEDGGLAVTHGGAMRAAVSVVTGLNHRQVWAFDLPYGALLSLRIWPGHAQVGGQAGGQVGGQIIALRGKSVS